MNQRLSAADMSSLLAERGPIHVHVGGTVIVEGPAPRQERFIAHIERRLHLVPRFRQRIVELPLGIANPVWGDDPGFDIHRHVRRVGLPRPGGDGELRDLVGRVMSEPLDFEHPLWQIHLVEGLRGGRHAVISKTHHALVDGVSAVDIGTLLLDPSPEGLQIPVPDRSWEPDQPNPAMLVAQAAREGIRKPLRAAGRAARTALTTPGGTASRVLKTADAFRELAAGGPTCPKTSLNVRVGRDRRVAWTRTSLARVKRARGQNGATVNDVVLAVAAGALRRWFRRRGERIPPYLVALVPVSVRTEEDEGQLGNRLSTLLVRLPLGQRSPRRRLELIREETERLKRSQMTRAASILIQATGWTPPTINRVLSQAMARPLVFNLVVSNVPGPQTPLYLLGRRLREIYPFVPLSPQMHALSIGVLSFDGKVFFGLAGDRDEVADVDALAKAIDEATAEQLQVAEIDAARARAKREAAAERRRQARERAEARRRARAKSTAAPGRTRRRRRGR